MKYYWIWIIILCICEIFNINTMETNLIGGGIAFSVCLVALIMNVVLVMK